MADQDVKSLLLQVDANVEIARRNLASLERDVARGAARMDVDLKRVDAGFSRLGAAAASAKNLIGGFLAGVGVSGALALGKGVLQLGDDIDASSKKAGISAERYQTLSEAFRRLEIDSESVDPVLKRLNATLGQVQNGTDNGATKALKNLGISAKVTNGEIKTADQLLDAIAESSKRAGSDAQFAADLVAILGRRYGVDLAAALREGGRALKEAEADIKSAGGVISDLAVSRLADANERIDRFVARSKIGFAQFAGDALAAFEKADRAIDKFIYSGFGTTAGRTAAGKRLAMTPEGIDELIDVERGKDAEDRDENLIFRLNSAKKRMLAAKKRTRAAADGPDADLRPPETKEKNGPKPREFDPFFSTDLDGLSGDLARKFEDRFKVDPLIEAILKDKGTGKSLEEKLADIDAVKEAELGRIEQVAQAEAAANAQREQFYDNISRNLSQAIVYGQDLGTALVNSFKAAAAEALASGLFDFLKSGSKGGFGGLITSIGAAFGGARASGGPVTPGRSYLVGERGQEMFVPNVPGRIIPNNMMGGGQQGGAVTVTVEPSPLFVTAVVQASQAAASRTTAAAMRGARRPSLPGGR